MTVSALVPNRLLARDAVALCRLVLNVKFPEQDYFDTQIAIDPNDILVRQQLNFSEILQRTSGSKLHSFLTTILALSYSSHDDRQTQVNTICNTTYQVKNSSEVFERICETDLAKKWLEKAIGKGRSVYMVVGMQTLLDAEIRERRVMGKGRSFDVTVPATAAVSAMTAVPIPLTDILDSGIGRSWKDENKTLATFFAPGEQVYAVQYRKVDFSWFYSKKLETAELEKGNRWKVYWLRSADGEEDEDEDIVEAKLEESLSSSDPVLGANCEHFKLDGGDEMVFAF